MAGEKQTSINFRVSKNNLSVSDTLALSEDLSGTDYYAKSWTVTTSWVAIPLDALASFDLIFIKNTDATNYIQLATDNASAKIFAKLSAGRGCFLTPDPAATLYWRANTASCVCNVIAVEP